MNIEHYIKDKLTSSNIEFSYDPIKVDERYHYLYLTTNTVNRRYYIGLHSSKKSFDKHYKGSGKALKESIAKYGSHSFDTKPIAYFYSRLDLEHAESIVVTDDLLQMERGKIYNLKAGGITDSINLEHSKFMVDKMSDPIFKQYWKQQVQYYKDHPLESKMKHHIETQQERVDRYKLIGQKNSKRLKLERQANPQKSDEKIKQMQEKSNEARKHWIIVEDRSNGTKMKFKGKKAAAEYLDTKDYTILNLIQGKSRSTELSKKYKVYYEDPVIQNNIQQYQYKDQYSRCRPIVAIDPLGNEVKTFRSFKEANAFIGMKPNHGFDIIIHNHYLCHGYFWKYLNDSQPINLQSSKNKRILLLNVTTQLPEHYFNSISEASKAFHTSSMTIKKHIASRDVFLGYIWNYL